MGAVETWITDLVLKIKIYITIYLIAVGICLLYGVVVYFTSDSVHLDAETFTTNGVYLLQYSFFQSVENILFGNIQSVIAATQKAIVFNELFRATTILVVVLAIVLMGFTMIIGDQKITIKEFFMDFIIIFGSAAILLYYDPTLTADPTIPAQPEKYITLVYNFLTSISSFISQLLFSSTSGVMNIKYADGTQVGYYAPIDVVSSLFFDPVVSYRFKIKLAALCLSPMVILMPVVIVVTIYFLVPVVLTVFIAIILAKTTIMFAVQFLPIFLLFSSVNDVKIKLNKKQKGMDLTIRLLLEGVAQPLVFLALVSFVAGFLFYIFIITNLSDVFGFSIGMQGISGCSWWYAFFCALLPDILSIYGINFGKFFFGVIYLWIGIWLFKHMFGKITPIVANLVLSAGAAGTILNQGKGVFDEKDNDIGKMVDDDYQKNVDSAINKAFGEDTRSEEEKKKDPKGAEKRGYIYGALENKFKAKTEVNIGKDDSSTKAK